MPNDILLWVCPFLLFGLHYFKMSVFGIPFTCLQLMPIGVEYSNLVLLIDFIYNGEIRVPSEEFPSFMALVKQLKIRGLSDAIKQQHDKTQHHKQNCQEDEIQEVFPSQHPANNHNLNHNSELSSTSSTISMTSPNVNLIKGIDVTNFSSISHLSNCEYWPLKLI